MSVLSKHEMNEQLQKLPQLINDWKLKNTKLNTQASLITNWQQRRTPESDTISGIIFGITASDIHGLVTPKLTQLISSETLAMLIDDIFFHFSKSPTTPAGFIQMLISNLPNNWGDKDEGYWYSRNGYNYQYPEERINIKELLLNHPNYVIVQQR